MIICHAMLLNRSDFIIHYVYAILFYQYLLQIPCEMIALHFRLTLFMSCTLQASAAVTISLTLERLCAVNPLECPSMDISDGTVKNIMFACGIKKEYNVS